VIGGRGLFYWAYPRDCAGYLILHGIGPHRITPNMAFVPSPLMGNLSPTKPLIGRCGLTTHISRPLWAVAVTISKYQTNDTSSSGHCSQDHCFVGDMQGQFGCRGCDDERTWRTDRHSPTGAYSSEFAVRHSLCDNGELSCDITALDDRCYMYNLK
jgi:hypothetical protein